MRWVGNVKHGLLLAAILAVGASAAIGTGEAQAQPSRDRAWLGVSLQDLGPELRDALNIERRVRGALVSDVVKGSPADRAGVEKQDVLVEVDNVRVDSVDETIKAVRTLRPGDDIRIVINRNGSERGMDVELGSLRDAEDRSFTPRGKRSDKHKNRVWIGGDDDDDDDDHHIFRWHRGDDDDDDDDGHHRGFRWFGKGDDDDEPIRIEIFRDDDDDPEVIVIDPDDLRSEIRERIHRDRAHGHKDRVKRHKKMVERFEGKHHDKAERLRERAERLGHEAERLGRRLEERIGRAGRNGGFLGVETVGLTDQLGEFFGVDDDSGVLVRRVVEDSPADRAGLRAGDVIVAVDGDTVEDPADLRRAVRRLDPGDEAEIRVIRDRSKRTIKVELDEADDRSSLEFLDLESLPGLVQIPELQGLIELDGFDLGDIEIPDFEFELDELPEFDIKGLDITWDSDDFSEEDMDELREMLDDLNIKLRTKLRGLGDRRTTYE